MITGQKGKAKKNAIKKMGQMGIYNLVKVYRPEAYSQNPQILSIAQNYPMGWNENPCFAHRLKVPYHEEDKERLKPSLTKESMSYTYSVLGSYF